MCRQSPSGLWDANDRVEESAVAQLQEEFAPFRSAIAAIYEAGVEVPTLPSARHADPDQAAGALFLKRTLVDLRGTWLLVSRGYSSPGAAVAASLWEHALAATVLPGNTERLKELRANESGDLPWSPKRLARLGAEVLERSYDHTSGDMIAERARNIYASYKWLCKIKHPTLRATAHDSGAAKGKGGTFVVMAVPDLRPENLPVKRVILTVAGGRSAEAIGAFFNALACDASAPVCRDFLQRLQSGRTRLLTLARADLQQPLPFSL